MTPREKALILTETQLQDIRRNGGLSAVAQALGQSGRGTPDELLASIRDAQKREENPWGSRMRQWANFLENEKLDPEIPQLIELCQAMSLKQGAYEKGHSYKERLAAREYLCNVAMALGMDLTAITDRHGRKCRMGRVLLDAWQKVYAARYDSTIGTLASKEVVRCGIKTVLAERRKHVKDQ